MIVNKEFVLVGAGFDNLNTRLPSIYNQEKHFRNAERLVKSKDLTIGAPMQSMLKNVRSVIDDVIETKDLNSRKELTKTVASFLANDIEKRRQIKKGYKPTYKI